jgi:hypothetical protein
MPNREAARMRSGTSTLGPSTATLRLHTRRQGLAAMAGHDLVIEVGQWEATLTLGEAPGLDLTADPTSLQIVEGRGGAKPLSDRDRREIRKNIEGKVLGRSPIAFRSTEVSGGGDGRLSVRGDLSLAGATAPVSFEVDVSEDGRVQAEATVTQTRWGIKPYTGLMGALKVADDVRIEVDGRLG